MNTVYFPIDQFPEGLESLKYSIINNPAIETTVYILMVSGEKSIVAVTLLSRPAVNSVSEHENIIRMGMKNIYLFIRMVLKFMSKFNYYYC